jgi:dolichol-phosphate mannosyltransferase
MNADSIGGIGQTGAGNATGDSAKPASQGLDRTSRADLPDASRRATISIVVPCYNESEILPLLLARLDTLAEQCRADHDFEIIAVDDGSDDGTWSTLCKWAETSPRLRGVRLSRNFGQQAAITCGYAMAGGDAVVCMDADLQDPPEVIPEMIVKWQAGADVVYAIRSLRDGETAFKRITAKLFYWLIQFLGARFVHRDVGDFRLLSHRALTALLQLGEQHRFVRGMVGWIGFPSAEVYYQRPERSAGTSKFPFGKMLRLATDAIVSFSRAPLHATYYLAATLSFVFLAYLAWLLVMHRWFDRPATPDWWTVVFAVVVFGAANLLCQALMGAYVARIFEQSKQRPLYIVQDTVTGKEVEPSS